MKVLILFSGGIDSTSLIPYYQNLNYQIELLFINYGQIAAVHEFSSAKNISVYYGIPLQLIELEKLGRFSGKITARNSFLIFTAIMYTQIEKGIISLGIHSGTEYPDCTPHFIIALQELLNKQELVSIRIDVPFIKMYKNEIWEYAKTNKVPLELTYSCELGLDQPCDKCSSCKDLIALHGTRN